MCTVGRDGFCSTVSGVEDAGACYVFGGYRSSTGLLNELLVFDLNTLEWRQPTVAGDVPTPRRGHAGEAQGAQLL